MDEKKATRICAERFPHLTIGSTVDLVGCMAVQAALGRDLADAIFNMLSIGRMRIAATLGLGRGADRAASCGAVRGVAREVPRRRSRKLAAAKARWRRAGKAPESCRLVVHLLNATVPNAPLPIRSAPAVSRTPSSTQAVRPAPRSPVARRGPGSSPTAGRIRCGEPARGLGERCP